MLSILILALAPVPAAPSEQPAFHATPATESVTSSREFARWKGACWEVNFVVRTDADNVRPMVDPRWRDDILVAGPSGSDLATLAFLFIKCRDAELATPTRRLTTKRSHEVSMLVILSDSDDSDEVFQLYALQNLTDWKPLADSHRALGHPTEHVPRLVFDLRFDAAGALAGLRVDVPMRNDRLSATATAANLNPVAVDANADEFVMGPRGALRVAHRAPETKITTLSSARITAQNPNGVFARALGRTETQTDAGVFFDIGPNHYHELTPW